MSKWTLDDSAGIWHLRLAKGFIDAAVRFDGLYYYARVGQYRMNTVLYPTAEEGKAAIEKYLERKLKEALVELDSGA